MKNHTEVLIFHTAICLRSEANSPDGRRETACADFSSPLREKSLRNGDLCNFSICPVAFEIFERLKK